jgi:hypothetical protein
MKIFCHLVDFLVKTFWTRFSSRLTIIFFPEIADKILIVKSGQQSRVHSVFERNTGPWNFPEYLPRKNPRKLTHKKQGYNEEFREISFEKSLTLIKVIRKIDSWWDSNPQSGVPEAQAIARRRGLVPAFWCRVARVFSVQITKTGKMCQITTKCTRWP